MRQAVVHHVKKQEVHGTVRYVCKGCAHENWVKKSLLSGLTNFDSLGYIRSDGRKLNRVNKPDKED